MRSGGELSNLEYLPMKTENMEYPALTCLFMAHSDVNFMVFYEFIKDTTPEIWVTRSIRR